MTLAYNINALSIGWQPTFTFSNLAMNAALSGGYSATWLDSSFVADRSVTLNTVRAYVTITGTLGASDLVCDIYSDANGLPNASLASVTLGAVPATGWITFSGFTQALTAGTPYHIVFRNANASPTSNYATYIFSTPSLFQGSLSQGTVGSNLYGWNAIRSTNSGTSWSVWQACIAGVRLGYSDGTFDGMLLRTWSGATDLIYSTRASGVKFTTPATWPTLNVAAVSFTMGGRGGSPSGNAQAQIYTGASPTLLATSDTSVPPGNVGASATCVFYFSSPVAIPANTIIRVVVSETANSDTSSNYYGLSEFLIDSDANSVAMLPFGGTYQKTYFDGTSWIDTQTSLHGCRLILDPNGEFTSSGGGGGGLLVHPGMSGRIAA